MFSLSYSLVFIVLQFSPVWLANPVKFTGFNQQFLESDLAALRGLFAKEKLAYNNLKRSATGNHGSLINGVFGGHIAAASTNQPFIVPSPSYLRNPNPVKTPIFYDNIQPAESSGKIHRAPLVAASSSPAQYGSVQTSPTSQYNQASPPSQYGSGQALTSAQYGPAQPSATSCWLNGYNGNSPSPSPSYGQNSYDNSYGSSGSSQQQPSSPTSSQSIPSQSSSPVTDAGHGSYGQSNGYASIAPAHSNGYSNISPVSNSYTPQTQAQPQQQQSYNNYVPQSPNYSNQQSGPASQSASPSSNYGQSSSQPVIPSYTQVVTADQTYPSSVSRDYSSQSAASLAYNTVPQIIPPSYTSSADSSSNYGQPSEVTSSSASTATSGVSPSSSGSPSSPSYYNNEGYLSSASTSTSGQNAYSNSYTAESQPVKSTLTNTGYESDSTGPTSYQSSGYSSASSLSTYTAPSQPSFRPVYSMTSTSPGTSYKVASPASQSISPVSSTGYNSEPQITNEYYSDPDCKDTKDTSSITQSNVQAGQGKGTNAVHANPSAQSSIKYSPTSTTVLSPTAITSLVGKPSYGTSSSSTGSSSQQSSASSSSSSPSSSAANLQTYDPEDLDPSKLDLKIVHLPVSVLKKLVGNGDAMKQNYQYQQ